MCLTQQLMRRWPKEAGVSRWQYIASSVLGLWLFVLMIGLMMTPGYGLIGGAILITVVGAVLGHVAWEAS
jgi:hypothetical protein